MCMIITPLPSPSCRADLFESTSFSHPSCGMTCGDWLALSLMLLLWVHLDIPLFCKLWSTLEMKTECWRIDTFELWCWRRLFKVPWTARRSKQSILKKINLECSLERLILKLKFQYFGPLCEEPTHWERPWCWEGLRAGGEGDDRGWDGWTAPLTRWTWVCYVKVVKKVNLKSYHHKEKVFFSIVKIHFGCFFFFFNWSIVYLQ